MVASLREAVIAVRIESIRRIPVADEADTRVGSAAQTPDAETYVFGV